MVQSRAMHDMQYLRAERLCCKVVRFQAGRRIVEDAVGY